MSLARPDQLALISALHVGARSPCRKSRRGVVAFNPAEEGSIYSWAHNRLPVGECDGSSACRQACGDRCIHAEAAAMLRLPNEIVTGCHTRTVLAGVELIHVKMRAETPSDWHCPAGLLADPDDLDAKVETVNDIDGNIVNVWRALTYSPAELAELCDHPVHEATLHAAHDLLLRRADDLLELVQSDPRAHDVELAAWWVWGRSCWLGSGWCRETEHLSPGGAGLAKRQMPLLRGSDGSGVGYGAGINATGHRGALISDFENPLPERPSAAPFAEEMLLALASEHQGFELEDGHRTLNGQPVPDGHRFAILDSEGETVVTAPTQQQALEDAVREEIKGLLTYTASLEARVDRVSKAVETIRSGGCN
jgi:hypothetical protein